MHTPEPNLAFDQEAFERWFEEHGDTVACNVMSGIIDNIVEASFHRRIHEDETGLIEEGIERFIAKKKYITRHDPVVVSYWRGVCDSILWERQELCAFVRKRLTQFRDALFPDDTSELPMLTFNRYLDYLSHIKTVNPKAYEVQFSNRMNVVAYHRVGKALLPKETRCRGLVLPVGGR